MLSLNQPLARTTSLTQPCLARLLLTHACYVSHALNSLLSPHALLARSCRPSILQYLHVCSTKHTLSHSPTTMTTMTTTTLTPCSMTHTTKPLVNDNQLALNSLHAHSISLLLGSQSVSLHLAISRCQPPSFTHSLSVLAASLDMSSLHARLAISLSVCMLPYQPASFDRLIPCLPALLTQVVLQTHSRCTTTNTVFVHHSVIAQFLARSSHSSRTMPNYFLLNLSYLSISHSLSSPPYSRTSLTHSQMLSLSHSKRKRRAVDLLA